MVKDLFGNNIQYSKKLTAEELKVEKKKFNQRIVDLEEFIENLNYCSQGKKSTIFNMTKEQIDADLKKANIELARLKNIKKIGFDNLTIIEEIRKESEKLMSELIEERKTNGHVSISLNDIKEVNNRAFENVRRRGV